MSCALNVDFLIQVALLCPDMFCPAVVSLVLFASALDGSPIDAAVEVYRTEFGEAFDANYDEWPDGWTRRRGEGYPNYLKIGITQPTVAPPSDAKHVLRVQLDGGSAAAFSPSIPVSSRFSLVLNGLIRTENLQHDQAWYSLTFLNAQGEKIVVHESSHIANQPAWKELMLGPVAPPEDAKSAIIGVHVAPMNQKFDLRGQVEFTSIILARLPRMSLITNSAHNIYRDPHDPELRCKVSGVDEEFPELALQLFDEQGNVTSHELVKMEMSTLANGIGDQGPSYAGEFVWRPKIENLGFYRACATLTTSSGVKMERRLNLVVVSPAKHAQLSGFGWTLPDGELPLGFRSTAELLVEAGVSWVKFPVWFGPEEKGRAENIAWLAERLSNHQIRMIGLLDQPPAAARVHFSEKGHVPVGSVFVEKELWQPLLDPVVTRLSLKLHWWQLGRDDDTSFSDYQDPRSKAEEIKEHLARFGQEVQLVFAWRVFDETPLKKDPPWASLNYTTPVQDPPLTAQETHGYLDAHRAEPADRWITVRPLSREKYDLETRSVDFVSRIIAAKRAGADGIFIAEPMSQQHGLLTPTGTPEDMFLPWRSTAMALGDKQFLGSLKLPNGSKNYVFADVDGDAVMVIWSERPESETVTETLYLGEEIQQSDLWGRSIPTANVGREQQVSVSRYPTFVHGLNANVARWRMSFEVDPEYLASVFGREQFVKLKFANNFPQGVGGKVTFSMPDVWEISQQEINFRVNEGESTEEVLGILFKGEANSGEQPVRFDFNVTADRTYQFSIYRTLHVGLGEIQVELTTHLDNEGNLVVEQTLENHEDRFVSFNCLLFAPERRRQRCQVVDLGRGKHTYKYFFPDGKDLLGKQLYLRAEEIGGDRVINTRTTAEE